jgi:hypothetical protein
MAKRLLLNLKKRQPHLHAAAVQRNFSDGRYERPLERRRQCFG